ncbi:MAG: ATP-binding protein [Rhodoferax sp.]
MLATLLGLSLLLIWAAAGYEIYRTRQTDLHDAEVRTASQSQVFAEYSRSTFKRINEVILGIRNQWNGDWRAFAGLVTTVQENIDDLSFQVSVIDKNGLLSFSNLTVPTDRTDLSGREHFRVHKEADNADTLFISRPVLGKVSGKWSIQVTRPILRKGQFDGVVVVSVSPEKFASFAEKLGLSGGSVLTVVRDTGEIMARYPIRERSLGQLIKDRPYQVAGAPIAGNFQQASIVDGAQRIYGYYRIPEYGITFVMGEALTTVLEPYQVHRDKMLGGALAASFFATLLFFMLFRSFKIVDDVHQQLDVIFALSPDGFVSFDARRHVRYINPAFVRITGVDEVHWAGLDESAFSARLAALCASEASFPGVAVLRSAELTRRDRGGAEADPKRHLFELALGAKRVVEAGIRLAQSQTVSQVLYFRDVTHETEVDHMKSEFLATAAHEMRTPMASIYGFSEILLNMEFPPEEQREYLSIIHNQTGRMTLILDELLDLARIEARRGKDFELIDLEVGALIHVVVTNYKTPTGRLPPVDSGQSSELWLRADRGKLIQAIGNVLSNAYKYSPDGGVVEICVLEQEGSGGEVGIRVTDQGIGMTDAQVARVFERFYRADASGRIPGTGLGMSIVKEIVELHGGRVEIASQFGAGTTVTLWLPVGRDVHFADTVRAQSPY